MNHCNESRSDCDSEPALCEECQTRLLKAMSKPAVTAEPTDAETEELNALVALLESGRSLSNV